ncbi:MAG: class I SAM-dependent methyltransferase, partial [Nitrospirales bacterium]
MTYLCQSCKHDKVNLLLDVGELPLCNRYLSDQDESECRFPMAIGQCQHCFLVQMVFVVPVHELTPRFSWLSYNEPDAHLDKLACRLCSLPGISKISKIMGISYKDDPLLERFRNRKFSSVWRPDPQIDLGVKGAGAGVETIEELLTLDTVNEILNEHGKADILLIRHIVEHSRDLHKFLTKMKMLVKPQGYMVIEVPDCSKAFQNCDYTTLWEEHIAYFTPATFLSSLHHCALKT